MYRVGFLPFLALTCAGLMNARSPAADLAGDWMGTLGSGAEKLRLKLHVIKTYDGLYIGKLLSIDQGDGAIPVRRVVVQGRSVALEFPVVNGSFKGDLSPNGSTLAGKWTQGDTQPLTFKRSGPAPAEPPKEAKRAFALGCVRRRRSAGASDSISRRGRAQPLDVRTAHNQLLSGRTALEAH